MRSNDMFGLTKNEHKGGKKKREKYIISCYTKQLN